MQIFERVCRLIENDGKKCPIFFKVGSISNRVCFTNEMCPPKKNKCAFVSTNRFSLEMLTIFGAKMGSFSDLMGM